MSLDDWRSRINDLDEQILNLLNQRARAALAIGDLKRQQELPYFVPEREAQILDRLAALNGGPLGVEAVRAIWREILSASLALEHPFRILYFGPAATYTHQAATKIFGSSATFQAMRSIGEVFDEMERGRAEFGVVPVENSTEGSVNITLDRLIDSELSITGEVTLEISHHLLSRARALDELKVVCSHQQAIAQCRQWLGAHLPDVPAEETSSTAAAAERAAGDPTVGAIASELAAALYGVPVLGRRIEDNPYNSTRFLVLGCRPMAPTGRDKTSILFSMKNEPGVLFSILEPFARARVNLTKIESRPTKRRPWEYITFVDFEGHRDTDVVRRVIAEARERCQFFKVLGSYPAAA
jgi:chorismate mutase/prephenate dehydratase